MQRDVASRSGLRPDRLARYESGEQPPPVYALTKIAEALGRPVDTLLPEIHMPEGTDRELYRLCRRLWCYPEPIRAICSEMLRIVFGFCDQTPASDPRGGQHHAAPRR